MDELEDQVPDGIQWVAIFCQCTHQAELHDHPMTDHQACQVQGCECTRFTLASPPPGQPET